MNRFLPLLLAAPLALAACADADGDGGVVQEIVDPVENAADAPEPYGTAPAPTEPRMEDGVQVVDIEAGSMGYQPRQIQLQAGVPARLVFTRTVESECSSQITLPAYNIAATDLPLGEAVAIEFTPTEAGEVDFVCGMDMQRGTIAVVS